MIVQQSKSESLHAKKKFQRKSRTNKRVKTKFKRKSAKGAKGAKGESGTCKRWINIKHTS